MASNNNLGDGTDGEQQQIGETGPASSTHYRRRNSPPTNGGDNAPGVTIEMAPVPGRGCSPKTSPHQHHRRHQHHHQAALPVGGANSNPAFDGDDEDKKRQQQIIISMMSNSAGGSSIVKRRNTEETIVGPADSDSNKACEVLLMTLSVILFILTFPIAILFSIRVVQEYERVVIFRLGHLVTRKPRGPGIFFILPCIDKYVLIDLRTHTHDVEPQEILTKDSVTVTVDAVVYYRVVNPILAVVRVADYEKSIDLVSVSILRNVLGTRTLTELLGERDTVSLNLQALLDDVTENWGVKVERVEIKNVQLPVQLQRAMATEAEAAREALARVIAAEGEHKASHALKKAADVIAGSPGALQLRYMQTLAAISSEKNSTIIFPIPIEVLHLLPKPQHERMSGSTSSESIRNAAAR